MDKYTRSRISKARTIASFDLVGVVKSKDNRATLLAVPGSEGKRYNEIVRRSKIEMGQNGSKRLIPMIELECLVDAPGQIACQGASKSICYHQLAGIYKLASDEGCSLVLFGMDEAAKIERFRNLHANGRLVLLASRQSGKRMWGYFWKE